jgi:hypothetical protein
VVTFQLETSNTGGDKCREKTESLPEFSEDGIDYYCEEEITIPRSETPDFIYEIVPHIDEITHIKIIVGEHSEQLWINEFEEGKLTIAFFVPESWKESGKQFGSGLRQDQSTLQMIAEGLDTLCQGQSERSTIYTDPGSSRNLNHILNKEL